MTPEELPHDVRSRTATGPGCWLWTGPTANRYDAAGQLVRRAVLPRRDAAGKWRTTTTARAVLEHALGRQLKPGELALHTCDVPLCVRPSHLYAGDARDNMADALRRGRIVTAGRRPQVRPQVVESAPPPVDVGAPPTAPATGKAGRTER